MDTRDATAITGASFVDKGAGSCLKYDVSASAITTAKCKLLRTRRIEQNSNTMVDIPSTLIDFYLTAGDYLIITCERDNPALVSNVIVSLEMGEEI